MPAAQEGVEPRRLGSLQLSCRFYCNSDAQDCWAGGGVLVLTPERTSRPAPASCQTTTRALRISENARPIVRSIPTSGANATIATSATPRCKGTTLKATISRRLAVSKMDDVMSDGAVPRLD